MKHKEVVAVALSGGVDSSVAAALLVEQNYSVIGLTMQLWNHPEVAHAPQYAHSNHALTTINDARAVCQQLGIPHYVINIEAVFEEQIIQEFIEEYLAGRTPNPCVRCNYLIKWGALLQRAQQIGATKFATGHYVRCEYNPQRQRYVLLKGLDPQKEQSYVLWRLTQAQLAQTIFPVGHFTKAAVRQKAKALGLKIARKSESQEICFIPDNDYEHFLLAKRPELIEQLQQGEVINEEGRVLGFHRGYPFYTIGQRKGLRVAAGHRIYVNKIDPLTNRIYVGRREKIFSKGLRALNVNWVALDGNFKSMSVTAKIRYKDPGFPAILEPVNTNEILLHFLEPQKSVTPGQSVVFYQGDELVGGGIIENALS